MAVQSDYLLNDAELNKLGDDKKLIYVYDWLRKLHKLLLKTQKDDIKDIQKVLVDQLLNQMQKTNGHPTRKLIAKCLSTLFTIGDTFLLFNTINKCIDVLKNKDDSQQSLSAKLSSIVCIGIMYENLGRLMGRTYEETVQLLLKILKNSDSLIRFEIYSTLKMIIIGIGTAAGSTYRDIYKSLKHGLVDRSMPVRSNAARCLHKLIEFAPFLYTTEIENVFSLCFRSLDGSNYEVRCAVSQAIGFLVATTQNSSIKQNLLNHQASSNSSTKVRILSLDEVLNLLSSGYLRGGIGFLKAGEMIKGSSTANREIRVGLSHAYVAFLTQMGHYWIEKNLSHILNHLFEVLTNPKSASTLIDAIHSRRCIGFILRLMFGKVLTEKGQFQAIKELIKVIVQYSHIGHSAMPRAANSNDYDLNNIIADSSLSNTFNNSSTKNNVSITNDIQMAQNVLVVALLELGTLVNQLGASCLSVLNDSQINLLDAVCFVTNHPSHVVRLSSAWCLRCISSSVNGQLTPLFERALERLETLRSSPESINGHSYVLSALLGTVRYTPLGIPQNKGKIIFNIAEDLLRTASQNSRLSMPRTQAGWQLMGAVMTLGHSVVKNLLPRLLLLWKNSFPRNTKELDSEKARGDAFTWQITLENRAGALAAIASFLNCCPKLLTDDIRRRLLTPIESAITMLVSLNSLFKSLGPAIKASYTMVRLRLYQVLLLLHPQLYENCFPNLLRLLVSDLTLTENVSNTSSSLLRTLIQTNADIILGSWIQETEHHMIEDQIQSYLSCGVGSIEYDPTILYKASNEFNFPSPLPLAVAIIDKSALVFALVFPYVAQKHRIQMLNHFQECIKQVKSTRQESIQINILTAILGALKTLAESKMNLGTDEVRKLVMAHIFGAIGYTNPLIRYASAECLGRCVQTINDARFLSEITHQCFEKLRTARDAITRTGYSLAIGFIHHYVVGMGSIQQLKTNISLLLALAEDHSSPSVQIWALHSITLIAESGGPMFRPYIEPTFNQCMKILLVLPPSLIDVYQSIGKCLSAMITTIGPEFQSDSHVINEIRLSILIACSVLEEHGDFLVKSEMIGCLQQLQMFDRKYFDLKELISVLCGSFLSHHYLLRKASISCLHQIAQKDSNSLVECGSDWVNQHKLNNNVGIISNFNIRATNSLPGIFVALLDFENDLVNALNVKKILNCLIQNIDQENLNMWLSLCKEVLSASDISIKESNEAEFEDGDFEESGFKTGDKNINIKISYRWQTRVLIMNILSKIIANCSQSSNNANIHFDLTLASEQSVRSNGKQDYLVLHLSDLVRMSFIGATSDCDDLRLVGLKTLELVIDKFAQVPEPEFPNHVILEQFQAQVGAALRPAFAVDTASHVTAMACQVCSAWIGSGVARDLNDLRRVHQLLVSSLDKLHKNSTSRIYNESASTMEKLAILKAWAEVYVVAMNQNCEQNDKDSIETNKENLLHLVTPELLTLSKYWIFALKDHALLTLPAEFVSQIPPDGGTFFILETIEIVRPMYRTSWPSILNAAALWLCTGKGFEILEKDETLNISKSDQFYLLFGICMEALSNPKSTEQSSYVSTYLASLKELITQNEVTKSILANNTQLILELCQVLHRLLLTHEISDCQIVITEIIKSIIQIQAQYLVEERSKMMQNSTNPEGPPNQNAILTSQLGEGDENGDIKMYESAVYSLLEICLSILVRQLPQLCPTLASTPEFSFIRSQKSANYLLFNSDNARLISNVLLILSDLPSLCSPHASLTILPTILYLLTGVFCELSVVNQTIYDEKLYEKEPILTFLKCIKSICTSPFMASDNEIKLKWITILQSAVARILDMSKTSDDEQKQDFLSTLLTIGVFAIYSPPEVLYTPQLQYPVINLMTQALQSEKDLVQLKCIETLKLMFSQSEHSSTIYIHILASKMIQVLHTLINCAKTGQDLNSTKIDSILNILDCLGILIEKALDGKKINMLSIYIPALISLLNIECQLQQPAEMIKNTRLLSCVSTRKVMLHDFSLKMLTEIGPKYPDEFRQIMASNSSYSESLKNAIRNQQLKTNNENDKTGRSDQTISANKQTIKLKVDFSNYK